jgi:hypothetical protein
MYCTLYNNEIISIVNSLILTIKFILDFGLAHQQDVLIKKQKAQ